MSFPKDEEKIPDAYFELVLKEVIDFNHTEGEFASLTDAEKLDSVKKG